MQTLYYDLRYALRQLSKTPGLALLAVLTLALGVGANTAIFTVIESVLLRPLPYAHADRLLYIGPPSDKPSFDTLSWMNYRDVHAQSKLLMDVAGYSEELSVIQSPEGSESVVAPQVTTNLLSMLGAQPLLGRTFTDAEGQAGGPRVVLLSQTLWRETFHSDPNILGQQVKVGGIARTVVGVLPKTFHFPESMRPDLNKGVWLPLQPSSEMLKDRGYNFFKVVGELGPGVTVAEAQRELDAIAARIPRDKDEGKVAFQAGLYQEILTGPVRPVLFGLFGALALVLLIACANVSNLLIARCLGRQQEFAVRAALGASRRRLIRQMLSEGLALSLFGCGAGAGLAQLAMIGVRKLTGTIPNAEAISIHWTVVLVLAAIAILTTVLSSLLPALLVARVHPQAALQAASRGLGSRTVSGKLSGTLVATEVALSTLLLVGTGLLFHTLWNLEQSHLGFDAARVTSFGAMPADVAGSASAAVSDDTANAPISVAALTYEPMLERIRRVPGIESAALVTSPPLVGGENIHSTFEVVGRPDDPAHEMGAQVTAVSGDYARTLGTPIVRGRMIESGDGSTAPSVIAINETLAKKYFPGTDPLGKQIDLGGKETGMLKPFTIVGILGDQVDTTVGSAPRPLLFLSQQQIPTTSIFYPFLLKTIVRFVVKTRGDIPLAVEMRSLFKQNAPGFALDDFRTMQDAVDQNTFNQRLGLYLVGSFAGLAVAMVFAGLYGVLSQLVSYRKREIGVRMALGATRLSVAQLVLRQGSLLVGAGLAVGLALALATGRLVSSFLYQVKPLDAFTYAGVVLAVALIGLAAALLPARKAASIEPMQALRED